MRVPIEKGRYLTLVNVYAPTMTYSVEEKETFYQELTHTVLGVPREDKLLILGDFNARVGMDWDTYRGIIGPQVLHFETSPFTQHNRKEMQQTKRPHRRH